MTEEITVYNGDLTEIQKAYTNQQLEVISRTIAPELTQDELYIFLHMSIRSGLDPFARQIYGIKRKGKLCIQTGIDGFRLIAERTGKYAPGNDTQFIYDSNGKIFGAKAYVKKMTKDGTWHSVSATAYLSEYMPGKTWQDCPWLKLPHIMLEKCAESRALRRCFPADLSGLYTKEEMEQADAPVLNDTPPLIKPADSIINDEKWFAIDNYLNGNEELREQLMKLCGISNLRNIKESQLGACKKFAKNYLERKKTAKKKADNDDSTD